MDILRLTGCLSLLLATCACKTQRSVLAGPTVTGLESKGSDDASGRFSNQDPFGYMQNESEGVNALSGRMFGGKLETQSQKEFAASKKFLTREYGGQKDIAAKTWRGKPESRSWTDKLFDTDDTSDTASTFRDGGREAPVKDSTDAAKVARTSDFAGAGRAARTSNYRPAEKALEPGRDEPKLSSARPDRMNNKEKAVHDRIANSNATASEINKFLGKP